MVILLANVVGPRASAAARQAHVRAPMQRGRSEEGRAVRLPLGCGDLDPDSDSSFASVDLAFLSAMQLFMNLKMLVSGYDINCQYQINFAKRMGELESIIDQLTSIEQGWNMNLKHITGVGKFHLPAHKASCRDEFSFRNLPGVGQTDGEALERIWAALNNLALRTREMAGGHRHDTINEFHDAKNEERTRNMGK